MYVIYSDLISIALLWPYGIECPLDAHFLILPEVVGHHLFCLLGIWTY